MAVSEANDYDKKCKKRLSKPAMIYMTADETDRQKVDPDRL